MRHVLALVALALPSLACKQSPEQAQAQALADAKAQVDQLCDAMNDLSLLYVAGLQDMEVESLDPPGTRESLRAACKTLPLEVARCADRLALDDPTCDQALGKHLGMTDAKPEGRGPAPRWVLDVPFEAFDLAVSSAGHVALAGETGVAVVEDGQVQWKEEVEGGATRVGWWKGCMLAGVGGTLRCYDEHGEVSWSAPVVEGEGAWLSAIEVGADERVVVVGNEGTIARIDPEKCNTGPEGCVTSVATVEALGGAAIALLPSGAILGSNDSGVTLVSATGTVLAQRPAEFASSVPSGDLVVVGKEVLRAHPACTPSADDCFSVLATHDDMELVAPIELPGVGLAHADSYGVIHMVGQTQWKVDAGNDGDLLSDGITLFSVGHQLGLGDAMNAPPQVRAIDPKTGRTRWITPLGTERASLLGAYLVELRGESLVVSTKTQLFAVPLASG